MNGSTFYSEGTLGSMLAGLQLTFGSHVGNRADQFTGEGYYREETDEYVLIRNVSDGVIVYVEDKLGILDAITGGMHERPAEIVFSMGMHALATIAMLAVASPVLGIAVAAPLLAVFAGTAAAIASNEAATQATGVGVHHLISWITDEIDYDAGEAMLLKKFAGADGPAGAERDAPGRLHLGRLRRHPAHRRQLHGGRRPGHRDRLQQFHQRRRRRRGERRCAVRAVDGRVRVALTAKLKLMTVFG